MSVYKQPQENFPDYLVRILVESPPYLLALAEAIRHFMEQWDEFRHNYTNITNPTPYDPIDIRNKIAQAKAAVGC